MSLKRFILPCVLLVGFAVFGFGSAQQKPASTVSEIRSPLVIVGAVADRGAGLTHEDLAKLNDADFKQTGDVPTFGFSSDRHWIKLRVVNTEDRKTGRILEVNNPILNICNLYEIRGRDAYRLYAAGDDGRFSDRPIAHLNYQFPLEMAPNSTREFLLLVSSAGEQLQVPLGLWSATEISIRDEKDRLLRGIYFGIIIFVLLFNLFLYVIIRERSSLYYVVYIFTLLMLQLSPGGFAYRYFWPDSPYLANIANPFFASVSIFALIRFSQHFLQLREFYPKLNKWYSYAGYLTAANSLLALIYTPETFKITVLIINSTALVLNVMIIPTAVLVLRKNFKPARFFLLAFVVLVISVFFFILNNFGVLRIDFYAAYGLQIGSAAEVILLSFAIVDKFKRFREEAFERLTMINNMKAKANEVLEKKVVERTEEITAQKRVVEVQKEEILSSIRYAQRIQNSLLPAEREIKRLFSENFVLFKPRDIVSGDFYRVGETGEEQARKIGASLRLFAAVDCTGHGVPGALMSVLGHNGPDRCLNHPEVDSPAAALRFINREIVRTLQQEKDAGGVRDGMDMVLCAFNPETNVLQFSGAKNNLYVLRDGKFIVLKGDRISIGADINNAQIDFTDKEIELQKDDLVYTFTDGFPDQFGGEAGKKLKSKTVLNMISEPAGHPMEEQRILPARAFELWRGENEQIDDVCMMGIRVR